MTPTPHNMQNREAFRFAITAVAILMLVIAVYGCARMTGHEKAGTPQGALSPFAMCPSRDGAKLYIAAQTANRVLVFDTAARRVTAVFDIPGRPTGLALSGDGGRLYVTAGVSPGYVYVLDSVTGTELDRIQAGHSPCSPVTVPGDTTLYVLNRFDNSMSIIDLRTSRQIVATPMLREPVAAEATPDGRYIVIANQLPSGERIYDYVTDGGILMIGSYISSGYFSGNREAYATSGVVLVFDTRHRRLAELIKLPNGSTDLLGIDISPDGNYAYVTHILGRYHLPTTQLERGWIAANALSVIDLQQFELVNTVLLDDLDRGAANPWGVTCTPDGSFVCVAHAGTNEISVIDRRALHGRLDAVERGETVQASSSPADVPNDLTFLRGIRQRIATGTTGTREIAAAGSRIYASGYFSDTLVEFPIESAVPGGCTTTRLGPETPMTLERRGEMYFNDGRLCFQGWLSCVTCHPDGRADALNWDLLNDGIGNPKNTKSLLYSHRTPPVMVTGIRADAETAVRAGLTYIQFSKPDEDIALAIDAYLKSLEPVPSPFLENGRLCKSAKRGKKVYEQAGCADCHPSPLFTDKRSYDVATGVGDDSGLSFDTPTLVEIWRTKPYLYDGRADTMHDVLRTFNHYDVHGFTGKLDARELGDLLDYIMSL